MRIQKGRVPEQQDSCPLARSLGGRQQSWSGGMQGRVAPWAQAGGGVQSRLAFGGCKAPVVLPAARSVRKRLPTFEWENVKLSHVVSEEESTYYGAHSDLRNGVLRKVRRRETAEGAGRVRVVGKLQMSGELRRNRPRHRWDIYLVGNTGSKASDPPRHCEGHTMPLLQTTGSRLEVSGWVRKEKGPCEWRPRRTRPGSPHCGHPTLIRKA